MPSTLAIITLNVDPAIELGPLTLSWHGLTIAAGILVGGLFAGRFAARRGLDRAEVWNAVLVISLAGMVGAKLFYLLVDTPSDLLRPGEWVSGRGFAFYGALIFGTAAVALYLRRQRLGLEYLDALAFGFPVGMALGRIGDVINGEHYGPPTDAPWGFRYLHPEADVPSSAIAYHSGGFYELVLALLMAPIVWRLAKRLRRPGMLLWSVIALYGAGRFAIFFFRSDSEGFILGLNAAQGTSLALIVAAGLGAALTSHPTAPTLRGVTGTQLLVPVLIGAAMLLGACARDSGDETRSRASAGPVIEDPGPVHVHGLGVNPRDGALFIATHTGLFRAADRESKAKRVAGRYQDTMAFTVIGPDRFLGSGHPDGRERLPPFLGLIESRNAGLNWRPRSLQGEMDFHILEARGRRIYGYGSEFESRTQRFVISEDGGRRWRERPVPEPLLDLAVDPEDRRRILAAGEQSLHLSRDGGRTWTPLGARPGLLEWPQGGEPHLVRGDGVVQVGDDELRRWRAVGDVGGQPSAFASGRRGELLTALHDGTIKRSTDGGLRWTVRSRP